MSRPAIIFLLAIFLPALGLGFLALRGASEQGALIEKQAAELRQQEADALAEKARYAIDREHEDFIQAVQQLLKADSPEQLSKNFAVKFGEHWLTQAVPFAVHINGQVLSPSAADSESNNSFKHFLANNSEFLRNESMERIFTAPAPTRKRTQTRKLVGNTSETNPKEKTIASSPGVLPLITDIPLVPGQSEDSSKPERDITEKVSEPTVLTDEAKVSENQINPSMDVTDDFTRTTPIPEKTKVATQPVRSPSADINRSSPDTSTEATSRNSETNENILTRGELSDFTRSDKPQAFGSPAPNSRSNNEGATNVAPKRLPNNSNHKTTSNSKNKTSPLASDEISTESAKSSELKELERKRKSSFSKKTTPVTNPKTVKQDTHPKTTFRQGSHYSSKDEYASSRRVSPIQQALNNAPLNVPSSIQFSKSNFAQLVRGAQRGIISRFVQNELEITFWFRPTPDSPIVFGTQINARDLKHLWQELDPAFLSPKGRKFAKPSSEACFVLLDDQAAPVIQSIPGFNTDWKRPFVATEIGEVLPHWEAAIYLTDPAALRTSADNVTRLLFFLIALGMSAMTVGGYLIIQDTRRQLTLVQKKSDFVSNVSHELKTPLTSIRMFAELLRDGRVKDPDRQKHHLHIITLESERLTRLINNVLDFAKLEHNQKQYDKREIDLHPTLLQLWESHELHLTEAGYKAVFHAAEGPYRVNADADAISQVLVNLLSNAEKYSGDAKEVEVHAYLSETELCISVMDRGPGVPKNEEDKIFEQFYRAHDLLTSTVSGSGLGLTLARRIAKDHGGDVTYEKRQDGGSRFTLKLPLLPTQS